MEHVKFVAYDVNDDVLVSVERSGDWPTLEFFAAHYPYNEVAEIRNSRETRTIPALQP